MCHWYESALSMSPVQLHNIIYEASRSDQLNHMSTGTARHLHLRHDGSLSPAGLPAESDFVHCEEDRTSCYYLNNTYLTYAQAVKACKRLDGAYLVAWNDADEQLRIEGYFKVGVAWCCTQSMLTVQGSFAGLVADMLHPLMCREICAS
jgi:hypothetical protein